MQSNPIGRRNMLAMLAAGALRGSSPKPLRGIFPIMQTPFTAGDRVDFPVLAKQVRWLEQCGTHGMVWPQLASEYYNLTKEERMEGVETILKAGKSVRPAIVIGVQAEDAAGAVEYAKLATRLGADALIALPPRQEKDWNRTVSYYKDIGASSPLPLFVQAIGQVTLENVIELARSVPTLRYIKDEAGPVLSRLSALRKRMPELKPFTGGHGKTLFDEMLRGVEGTMPAAGWVDLHAAAWDAFHAGDRVKAAEMCGRALLLVTAVEAYGMGAVKYILHLRGLFPNYEIRRGNQAADGANNRQSPLDDEAKRAIGEMLKTVRPYLRA
jgi:4-hydroxy-tetrahydrodipicolinate synthase